MGFSLLYTALCRVVSEGLNQATLAPILERPSHYCRWLKAAIFKTILLSSQDLDDAYASRQIKSGNKRGLEIAETNLVCLPYRSQFACTLVVWYDSRINLARFTCNDLSLFKCWALTKLNLNFLSDIIQVVEEAQGAYKITGDYPWRVFIQDWPQDNKSRRLKSRSLNCKQLNYSKLTDHHFRTISIAKGYRNIISRIYHATRHCEETGN